MKQIILYGHLAKKFGRHHRFDVRTPAEAMRALQVNFPGFREHVMAHNEPGYHVRVGKDYRNEEGLLYPADGVIKVIPAVAGASGAGMVILGAALMVMTGGAAIAALSSFAIGTGSAGVIGAVSAFTAASGMIGSLGLAMVLGGVSQMLFQPPKAQSVERPENKPSYSFNGPVNTTVQGNPVPVCYGRLIVGSQVVSAGISTTDIPVNA